MNHLKLSEEELDKILKNYNIGKLVSLDKKSKAFDTGVYVFKTNKGKFVIKCYGKATYKKIKQPIDTIDYLYSKKIPVVKNIKDKNGKEINKLKKEYFTIQKYVEGKEGSKNFNNTLIKDFANNFAKMHKELLKRNIKRQKITEYVRLKFPKNISSDNLNKQQNKIVRNLRRLNEKKLRKTFIHGDISIVNFLVKNNKIQAFIDWGDSHYGYIVYDLATLIAHNFINTKSIQINKIKLLLDIYQKSNKLNHDEKIALYYLIQYRLLIILEWYTSRMQKFGIKSKHFRDGIKDSISRIKKFNTLSLDEFLKIISSKPL